MTRQPASLPVLPTTVIGSYPVPEWLERLKTDYYRNRISRTHLYDYCDTAVTVPLPNDMPSLVLSNDFTFTRQRTRRALDMVSTDKLLINPDCGLRHVPADVARAKLYAMVEGVAEVRRTLTAPVTTSSAIARPSDDRPQSPHGSPRDMSRTECRARSLMP